MASLVAKSNLFSLLEKRNHIMEREVWNAKRAIPPTSSKRLVSSFLLAFAHTRRLHLIPEVSTAAESAPVVSV